MRGPGLPLQQRLLEVGLGAVDARVAYDEFFARDPAALLSADAVHSQVGEAVDRAEGSALKFFSPFVSTKGRVCVIGGEGYEAVVFAAGCAPRPGVDVGLCGSRHSTSESSSHRFEQQLAPHQRH